MNTLTDLRRTLDEHADDVADPAAVARTASVHHRVAVVRRRRRAAGTGALALALVIGVVATIWPRPAQEPAPAGPVVLGQRAPATMTSLGYTYRTDGHGESFGRSGSIRLTRSDEPRLFSWTTDGASSVRITLPDGDVMHSNATGFRDFVVLPSSDGGRLSVHVARGRVGLASYHLTDAAPPGYTKDGVTFRREVAGMPLLTAAISDPGRNELTASYIAPAGQVEEHLVCDGLRKGQVIQLSFNGEGRDWAEPGNCDASSTGFDPAVGGSGQFRLGKPGTRVVVRAFVKTKARGGRMLPASEVPGLRMGFGIYGPTSQTRVGGWRIDDQAEAYGHTWQLTTTRTSSGAPILSPAADQDRLATVVWSSRSGFSSTSFRAGSSQTGGQSAVGGGKAATPGLWAPAGAPVHVRMGRGAGTFGVGLYERVD